MSLCTDLGMKQGSTLSILSRFKKLRSLTLQFELDLYVLHQRLREQSISANDIFGLAAAHRTACEQAAPHVQIAATVLLRDMLYEIPRGENHIKWELLHMVTGQDNWIEYSAKLAAQEPSFYGLELDVLDAGPFDYEKYNRYLSAQRQHDAEHDVFNAAYWRRQMRRLLRWLLVALVVMAMAYIISWDVRCTYDMLCPA